MEKGKTISPLFPEFPPVSKEKWKETVLKDLKGASFDKIVRKTYEGFTIEPFYTGDDTENLAYLDSYENIFETRSWENREKIKVENESIANKMAVEALHGGATGIAFIISNPQSIDFDQLLSTINLEGTYVSFILNHSALDFQNSYFKYLEQKSFSLQNIKGSLQFDPLAQFTLSGRWDDQDINQLASVIKASISAPYFYTLTVNNGPFKESGSSIVQELAYTLNMAAYYFDKLTDLGLSADEIARKVQFSISVGVDYFMEIAKLKALRILFVQVANAFGAKSLSPAEFQIHAYSSFWSKTIFDPSVNLLRDTTEAMSAILGGCDSLSLEPYDAAFKKAQPFLKRIARNVSTIIKDESYLDKVADPVAGSYYIENLINNLVENAWTTFQQVESEGGFMEAFKKGSIQNKIKALRDDKRNKIAGRREVILGTNQYPNQKESVDPVQIISTEQIVGDGVEVLSPEHAGKEFEDLRLDTERYFAKSGRKPAVYLLEYGSSVTMRKARASFSTGFLSTAGFKIVEDTFSADVVSAVEKAKKTDAEIVVFCGSDDDYAAVGEEFAKAFKSSVKDKLLVLAGYPAEIVDKLKAAGFDEFIHVRSNAIETLRGFQKKLNVI